MPVIFVYAELLNGKGRPAEVRGELRLRPNGDGAARFDPKAPGTVKGELHRVTVDQLRKLDRSEDDGKADDYKRVAIQLTDGTQCWAYEFHGQGWASFRIVPSGRWRAAPGHR